MARQLELFTGRFQLTETGLEVKGDPDFEEWMDYGTTLKTLDGTSRQFAIGDWIVHGCEHYQHGKWEAVQQVWSEEEINTLRSYEYVARNVKCDIRISHLGWSKHQLVAHLPPKQQRYWLEKAVENKWNKATLRQKISETTHIRLIKGDMLEVSRETGSSWRFNSIS